MELNQLLVIVLPAVVAAASAIVSAIVTARYAERRHQADMQLKQSELQLRILQDLLPERVSAYRDVFARVEEVRRAGSVTREEIDRLAPKLLWIDRDLAEDLVSTLERLRSHPRDGRALEGLEVHQEALAELAGARELNRRFRMIERAGDSGALAQDGGFG